MVVFVLQLWSEKWDLNNLQYHCVGTVIIKYGIPYPFQVWTRIFLSDQKVCMWTVQGRATAWCVKNEAFNTVLVFGPISFLCCDYLEFFYFGIWNRVKLAPPERRVLRVAVSSHQPSSSLSRSTAYLLNWVQLIVGLLLLCSPKTMYFLPLKIKLSVGHATTVEQWYCEHWISKLNLIWCLDLHLLCPCEP